MMCRGNTPNNDLFLARTNTLEGLGITQTEFGFMADSMI